MLDLALTTVPSLANNCKVERGMSDHEMIMTDFNWTIMPKKVKPRKVLLYKRGNMEGVRTELSDKFGKFRENSNTNTTEECWTDFKDILTNAIEEHIPSKMLSSRWDVPWLNNDLKRLIRKKQRVYNKAKKTKN